MSLYSGIFEDEDPPKLNDDSKIPNESKAGIKDLNQRGPSQQEQQIHQQQQQQQLQQQEQQQSNWSASLKFAPVARKIKKQPPKPAAPSINFGEFSISKPPQPANTNEEKPKEKLSEVEQHQQSIQQLQQAQTSAYQAPSMTIGNDENRFRKSNKGKRFSKSGSKKKKRSQATSQGPNWDDDYDPRKPTDYQEYKVYVKTLREEREAQEADNLARRAREASYSSSEYSDSDNDETDRKVKNKLFAPPINYDDDSSHLQEEPVAINKDETGDEVFQRRLAMSSVQAQEQRLKDSGDDAFARRLAMSQPEVAQQHERSPSPIVEKEISPQPQSQSQSFSDRLQVSQSAAANVAAKFKNIIPQQQTQPQPSNAFEERLKASQAAAANVAAKFKVSPSTAEEPEESLEMKAEVDDFLASIDDSTVAKEHLERGQRKATFAERFMQKHGWKEGEGLGAQKSGITQALSLEKTDSGDGQIINSNEGRHDQISREMYGEPSNTIVLLNAVEADDIDDDLSNDIADECSKHGTVQRVVVHVTDSIYPVRILVKFSGPVGAYKNVRELNGRYFGGKQVIAKYYPTSAFDKGNYDVSI